MFGKHVENLETPAMVASYPADRVLSIKQFHRDLFMDEDKTILNKLITFNHFLLNFDV